MALADFEAVITAIDALLVAHPTSAVVAALEAPEGVVHRVHGTIDRFNSEVQKDLTSRLPAGNLAGTVHILDTADRQLVFFTVRKSAIVAP